MNKRFVLPGDEDDQQDRMFDYDVDEEDVDEEEDVVEDGNELVPGVEDEQQSNIQVPTKQYFNLSAQPKLRP